MTTSWQSLSHAHNCQPTVRRLSTTLNNAGQAVLALPLNGMDVSVKLPPGLQLAATPAGHLDCRMQLLGVQLDWPSAGADSAGVLVL